MSDGKAEHAVARTRAILPAAVFFLLVAVSAVGARGLWASDRSPQPEIPPGVRPGTQFSDVLKRFPKTMQPANPQRHTVVYYDPWDAFIGLWVDHLGRIASIQVDKIDLDLDVALERFSLRYGRIEIWEGEWQGPPPLDGQAIRPRVYLAKNADNNCDVALRCLYVGGKSGCKYEGLSLTANHREFSAMIGNSLRDIRERKTGMILIGTID